ncbi:PHP domain-containing protein, partial [Parafrankia sp. FMc2]|uniref:PHP domain-containing protein n=1 Tax=Parafrankia sp. FMc2 TaxID=3233196 RepID=UPI003B589532
PAPRGGTPDPESTHLVILARDAEGYRRLSRAVSDAHLAGGQKGVLIAEPEAFAAASGGHWQILTGCRKGLVPRALATGSPTPGSPPALGGERRAPAPGGGGFTGMAAARSALDELVALFGRENVAVELWDHAAPLDSTRNDALAALARDAGLPDFPVPAGHDEASWLRLLTMQGAARRYGPPHAERVAGAPTTSSSTSSG